MTIFLIEESKEKNKYKSTIKGILNKIEEKIVQDKSVLQLPIKEDTKIKKKKIKKIVQKMEKYKINTVILSEKLYGMQLLKNELYSRNINILDGKILFKLLIEDIIEYICKKTNIDIEKIEIAILENDVSNINKQIIIELAERVKLLNIITNHIYKFKEIENYLYNEKGIIVKVCNNYKTALQKTKIILNIDFPEEIVNKYSIPNKCIIVNVNDEIKIKTKKFNGININNYNIIIPERYKIEGYNNNFIYESYIVNKDFQTAKKHILEDKIKIKNLVGEKGKINNIEFSFFS